MIVNLVYLTITYNFRRIEENYLHNLRSLKLQKSISLQEYCCVGLQRDSPTQHEYCCVGKYIPKSFCISMKYNC